MVEFVTQNYSPEIFAFCQYLENIVYSETLLKAKFYEHRFLFPLIIPTKKKKNG